MTPKQGTYPGQLNLKQSKDLCTKQKHVKTADSFPGLSGRMTNSAPCDIKCPIHASVYAITVVSITRG